MLRLLFEKTGDAVWISHLDLMRLFQRAFKRAGLELKHTQGYSPRALVSIALPLSVGVESICEILDYELIGEQPVHDEIVARLNAAMPVGIRVLRSYESSTKIRELTHLRCSVRLAYDAGIPEGAERAVSALFSRQTLEVEKKGKNGPVTQNLIPMIRSIAVRRETEQILCLDAVICAQEPTLNPAQIPAAIALYLPEYPFDHALIRRLQVLRADGTEFQ